MRYLVLFLLCLPLAGCQSADPGNVQAAGTGHGAAVGAQQQIAHW